MSETEKDRKKRLKLAYLKTQQEESSEQDDFSDSDAPEEQEESSEQDDSSDSAAPEGQGAVREITLEELRVHMIPIDCFRSGQYLKAYSLIKEVEPFMQGMIRSEFYKIQEHEFEDCLDSLPFGSEGVRAVVKQYFKEKAEQRRAATAEIGAALFSQIIFDFKNSAFKAENYPEETKAEWLERITAQYLKQKTAEVMLSEVANYAPEDVAIILDSMYPSGWSHYVNCLLEYQMKKRKTA